MAYDPALLSAIVRFAPAHLRENLVTTTLIETGGNPWGKPGDNGQSYGAYQEYSAGRGAGLTPDQRRDPVGSTKRAVREFSVFYDRGARGASLAYRAQRPADQADYLRKYAQYAPQARQILAKAGGTATPAASAPAGRRAGGAAPVGGGGQITPGSIAAVRRYAAQSEADVLAGRLPGDVTQLASSIKRTPGAPTGAGRQVALGGLQQAGRPSDPSDSQVVNAAKEQMGVPYSWGGGTPSGPGRGFGRGANTVGFDCSSLVQYAWAKVGVKLPRTTYDQIKVGSAVPNIAKSQPGDLLFPHTGHVMMAIGNGKAIEAPRTGGHVQIVDVSKRNFIAIRRPG